MSKDHNLDGNVEWDLQDSVPSPVNPLKDKMVEKLITFNYYLQANLFI